MSKPCAYTDKLAVFAASAQTWQQARIRTEDYEDEIPEWIRDMHDLDCIRVGTDGHAACECCGTRRLKVLYAVVPDGDCLHPRFIGRECLANLKNMGAIKNRRYVYPVIMWKNASGPRALEECHHDTR